MILGILLMLGAVALFVLAFRRLRAARDPAWVRAAATRLVIAPAAGASEPELALRHGETVAFGPVRASWDAPPSMSAVPAPVTGSGEYRVAAALDLSAEDAFGTGNARLAKLLREAIGPAALLLTSETAERPALLHGAPRARGSVVGVAIAPESLDGLTALLGDPAGLRVQVVRRRVQRAGWGTAQGQRHRGRQ